MLSVFPHLLDWAFFAPVPLRLAAGLFLLSHAYRHLHGERALAVESLHSRLGTLAVFSVWYMGIAELAASLSLLLGLFTQLGAILSGIVALQMLLIRKHAPKHFSHHEALYFFLLAISLSLLLTGAGPFAFDLPL